MASSPDGSIVRILTAGGKVVGAGFLVDTQHILTCAHVVNSAQSKPREATEPPTEPVTFDCPFNNTADKRTYTAQVTGWYAPGSDNSPADIAILSFDEGPTTIRSVELHNSANDLWGQSSKSVGFPHGRDGVWWSGTIRHIQARGLLQVDAALDTQYFVEQGFSGAPVWTADGRVIGMVVQAELNETVRAAYLIPAATLATVVPTAAVSPDHALTLPQPSRAPRMQDHIFISYDHVDRALVERLAGDLRNQGYTTWIDFEGIRGGDV